MVLHNPNNWHWVNKDVAQWARQYLDKNLIGVKAEQGDTSAAITKVSSMEGDVDVSQRKGKVITLFDVKLELEWNGSCKGEDDVTGKIKIPEVAHDTEEDEYVFDIDIESETSSKGPVRDLIRTQLTPKLRAKLSQLGPALISEHGKDIQHATGQSPELLKTKTTSSSSVNKSSSTSSAAKSASSSSGAVVNTVSITVSDEFRTTAEELYKTLTTSDRLAAFTRSPPTVFEGSAPGKKFALFGGNVSGSFAELDPYKKVVQKWRLGTWPEGHYSNLAVRFDQNDQDQVTHMRVQWDGVPVGEEDVVKRNWDEFYVKSIKRTFGFGTIL